MLIIIAVVVGIVFAAKDNNIDDTVGSPTGIVDTGANSMGVTQVRADSSDLYCMEFLSYSGVFVEDGGNTTVNNVAAALIKNCSDEYLDRAVITYKIGGRTATFEISGLPKGKEVLVLEKNKLQLKGGEKFEFVDCNSSFREEIIYDTDDLLVKTENNSLSVKNTSGEILKNVCVYYKTKAPDKGYYVGGITYMLNFGDIEPDSVVQKKSDHLDENSEIIRFSYQN